jgi:DNA-binding NtrC family response regulator
MGKILLVVDDERIVATLVRLLESDRHQVTAGTTRALNNLPSEYYDLVLIDLDAATAGGTDLLTSIKNTHPATEAVLLSGAAGSKHVAESLHKGAFASLTKPLQGEEVTHVVRMALEHRNLRRENLVLRRLAAHAADDDEFVSKNASYLNAVEIARRAAPGNSPVLLQGEQGTGKETLAQMIVKESRRAAMPFVTMNCASVPEILIESELFGHEKGSSPGANAMNQGLLEIADGGTLLLDEVGDVSAAVQPKLLRFLQTGEYCRFGGTTFLRADVRIISATSKDLFIECQRGYFREELLYRLNAVAITIPPLRERKEDIPELIQHYMTKKLHPRMSKTFGSDAMAMLLEYDWPGNMRELQNVIDGALALSNGPVITSDDLTSPSRFRKHTSAEQEFAARYTLHMSLEELEGKHIENVLSYFDWDKKAAAQALGVSLKTLYNKIAESGLQRKEE